MRGRKHYTKFSPRFLALTYVVITRLQLLCFLTTAAENYVRLSLIRFIMQWAMEWKEERYERCTRCAKKKTNMCSNEMEMIRREWHADLYLYFMGNEEVRDWQKSVQEGIASQHQACTIVFPTTLGSLTQKRRVQYILDMNIKLFVSFFSRFSFPLHEEKFAFRMECREMGKKK